MKYDWYMYTFAMLFACILWCYLTIAYTSFVSFTHFYINVVIVLLQFFPDFLFVVFLSFSRFDSILFFIRSTKPKRQTTNRTRYAQLAKLYYCYYIIIIIYIERWQWNVINMNNDYYNWLSRGCWNVIKLRSCIIYCERCDLSLSPDSFHYVFFVAFCLAFADVAWLFFMSFGIRFIKLRFAAEKFFFCTNDWC